jgi:hypothetical protein
VNSLWLDHVTLNLAHDDAITAGTNVTIDGGTLNYNGYTVAIGNLTVKNGGQVTAPVINNDTTTVESGTLTATSIICDTLTIGSPAGTANGASQSVLEARNAIACAPVSSTVSLGSGSGKEVSPFLTAASSMGEQSVPKRTETDVSSVLSLESNGAAFAFFAIEPTATEVSPDFVAETAAVDSVESGNYRIENAAQPLSAFVADDRRFLARAHLQAFDRHFEQSILEACLSSKKGDEPDAIQDVTTWRSEKTETHYWPKANGELKAHLAALDSLILDYQGHDSGDGQDLDLIRSRHNRKHAGQIAMALDDVFVSD